MHIILKRMKLALAIVFGTLLAVTNAFGRAGRIGRGFRRCGLPPFIEELPEEQGNEVKKVWESYKEGESCDDERDQTQQIVDKLPEDVRSRIFHHGGGPPFLRTASPEVRKQFRDLWHDFSLTPVEKKQKFRELAEKVLNKEQLDEFNKFEEEKDKRKKEFEEKVEKLSPKAKEVYEKLEKLKEEKMKIWREMGVETRDELKALFEFRFHGMRKFNH